MPPLSPSACPVYRSPIFFFHGYGAHRDLHSFPTRRSSDLGSGETDFGSMHSERSFSRGGRPDRKSTRLNSSHLVISYAVFCLKKKKVETFIAAAEFTSQAVPSLVTLKHLDVYGIEVPRREN